MKNQKLIVLNLMTEKGYELLTSISNFYSVIEFVVIGKDTDLKDDFSENIKNICLDNDIDFYYRENQPKIDKTKYIIAVSWRWLIDHPMQKLIIMHGSTLPKYRGFSPLVNMLINKEREIGVTAIFGSKEYDKGEIITQKSTVISYPIKIKEAIQINQKNFNSIALELIEKITTDKNISSFPQKESDCSYSIWRNKDDYYIDWNKSSKEINAHKNNYL